MNSPCAAFAATGGGSSIQEFTAANPYYPPQSKPFGVRTDVWIHVARPPSVRRPRRPILPNQSRETARAQSKTGEPRSCAVHRHVASTQLPVSPFVETVARGTTRVRLRPPTALQASRPSPAPASANAFLGFYSGHSPRLQGLKHCADQAQHRRPCRLPEALPALVMLFV
jgi:hypothetical protein